MSEEDYWNAPARTAADRYADAYGGASMQTAGKFQGTDSLNRQQELARIAGQAWDPSYYTPDGSIRIEVSGVAPSAESLPGDWHATGMPENASLRVVGQSPDGGLIWNTGAVSYAVAPPDIEVRALTNIVNSTTQPVYDPLTGLPTGYTTEADNANAPAMRYGEQMRNVGAFVGTLGKNFSLGVAQGTIGLVSDAAKGWAMIGDLAITGGSNVSRIDQFNLRPFEYDQGTGQFAGAVGEMFSPGAYVKGAKLGAAGLRALGPTADAALYNYLQRSGGILSVTPEGTWADRLVPHGFASKEEFAQFSNNMRAGLGRAGYSDVEPILQGSAVTGKSFKTGQPFDVGRVSDFDVGLASPTLLGRAEEVAIGLRSGGTRTGPLTARDLRALGLKDLSDLLSLGAGRQVNFMIYNTPATAVQRAPSITLPILGE
jgi:hypothetical protein